MAKKKTTQTTQPTSRGIIRDLLARAWAKVKGKPRSERGTKAEVEKRELKRIAKKTGRSEKQIRDIQKGKRPGKNLLEPLKQIKRGRKVQAPPKEQKKITRTRKPKKEQPPEQPPKPPEKPPEQPPEQPPAIPRPKRVKAIVRGNLGPYRDDDYIRERTIRQDLSPELTSAFLDALENDDENTAARIVVKEYFAPTGFPGYVESLSDMIDYEVIEEGTGQ